MSRYQIAHTTTYHYSQPVHLNTHTVRLRPRCDLAQKLLDFQFKVEPEPIQVTEAVDLDGNNSVRLTFGEPTDRLLIQAISMVETYRVNPFAFLTEPWAVKLPIDYPVSLSGQLSPYLERQQMAIDPVAIDLAQEILMTVDRNVISFLSELNQRIYKECQHWIRDTGDPWPAGMTWKRRAGACRDLTVLFMEVCRAVGLAARFVSGYQEGDLDSNDRHLHAWVEAYLPGAGWRGYDPTHGLAVADGHIALVATPDYRYAAPVTGTLRGIGATAQMSYTLTIEKGLGTT